MDYFLDDERNYITFLIRTEKHLVGPFVSFQQMTLCGIHWESSAFLSFILLILAPPEKNFNFSWKRSLFTFDATKDASYLRKAYLHVPQKIGKGFSFDNRIFYTLVTTFLRHTSIPNLCKKQWSLGV